MTEKDIETRLREEIKKTGGTAYKFVSPGHNGVPDRMICLPGGRVVFVELKAPGKKSSQAQLRAQEKLLTLGFIVIRDVDSYDKVLEVVRMCLDLKYDSDGYHYRKNLAIIRANGGTCYGQTKE
ncbi:MAG: VRR-NUC domain-containing protein [Oscillospiraceae bacterium]